MEIRLSIQYAFIATINRISERIAIRNLLNFTQKPAFFSRVARGTDGVFNVSEALSEELRAFGLYFLKTMPHEMHSSEGGCDV